MKISQILDRPIAFHRVFVTLTGSVKSAILLSQAIYWQSRAKQADGWWYKTADEWEDETGITRREQEKARKDCEKYLKSELRGVPATLYWKVDEDRLSEDLIGLNGESSFDKKVKLDSLKDENINGTETTTENTSETTTQSTDFKTDYKARLSIALEKSQNSSLKMYSDYPEYIQEWVKAFCENWHMEPPAKKSNRFKFWIVATQGLIDAAGEFGIEIISEYHEVWEKHKYDVVSPGSIENSIRAFAGSKRSGDDNKITGQWIT